MNEEVDDSGGGVVIIYYVFVVLFPSSHFDFSLYFLRSLDNLMAANDATD